MIGTYWRDKPDTPFFTLLSLLDNYVHPEAHHEAYDTLRDRAQRADPEDTKIATFKVELRRVLEGDAQGLHPDGIYVAAEYDDGSDEAFLRRLWTDLYPSEPVPQARSADHR